ncbi:hypothetical protein TNCV_940211 [Trichonephila clavipes]|nr:hypothetical protein TNCV_940211 [Trichonephila clavipes]
MGFWSHRPSRVPLLTAQHKALRLAWARQYRHWTADDWKHVAWSKQPRSQLIELMDEYGYGANLMNPWTLHVNNGLIKLVEAL